MKVVAFLAVLLLAMAVVGTLDYEDAEVSAKAQEIRLRCYPRSRSALKPNTPAAHLVGTTPVQRDAQILECRIIEERT